MKKFKIPTLVVALLSIIGCCANIWCTQPKATDIDSISIKYIGNSSFYLKLSDGTQIVTDPYNYAYDYYFGQFPNLSPDIVTISHDQHDDHTGWDRLKSTIKFINPTDLKKSLSYTIKHGEAKVFMPADLNKTIKIGSVEITGYHTDHVANMGDNTLFVYKIGKFKIVNMGETDTVTSATALKAIKDADVLLYYAGELGTKTNKDMYNFANKINAKVVIPEHYSLKPDNPFYNQPTAAKILSELPKGTPITKTNEFIVKKGIKKQFVLMSSMTK